MDSARLILRARTAAGLTQGRLAQLSGTSQPTVSAYESGRKVPTLDTLERLLAATGTRLSAASERRPPRPAGVADHERTARVLTDVLALAEALPARHAPVLDYPRLDR